MDNSDEESNLEDLEYEIYDAGAMLFDRNPLENDDSDEDNDSDKVGKISSEPDWFVGLPYIGSYVASVVRIQQDIKQTVRRGESVSVVRENPDGSYAIRTKIRGLTFGHLSQYDALIFSPTIHDFYGKLFKINAQVICNKNEERVFIKLDIYVVHNDRVSEALEIFKTNNIALTKDARCLCGTCKNNWDVPETVNILAENEVNIRLSKMFEDLRETDKTDEMNPADYVKTLLYPHQKTALSWMYRRENDETLPPFWDKRGRKYFNSLTRCETLDRPEQIRGGILADDMGLGKTLATVCLIVSSYRNGERMPLEVVNTLINYFTEKTGEQFDRLVAKRKSESGIFAKSSSEAPELSPFLSCRPKRARSSNVSSEEVSMQSGHSSPNLISKSSENIAADGTDEDCSNVLEEGKFPIERGDDKKATVDSTSSIIPAKIGLNFSDSIRPKLEVEVIDLSDDDEIPPMTVSPKIPVRLNEKLLQTAIVKKPFNDNLPHATLIVCPLTVLENWKTQIREHLKENVSIKIHLFYGFGKNIDAKKLSRKDIVLTSYGMLTSAYKKKTSSLFKIEWLRVILDEGHVIRNPDSQQSEACCSLKAQRRWILTGTPIQNRIMDVYSLVKFLRIEPLDIRACWRATIQRLVKQNCEEGLNRVRHLMNHLAMRRLKTQQYNGKPIVDIPPKMFSIELLELSKEERELYDVMHKQGKVIVNRYIKAGTLLHNYAHVLVILLRLRQYCCHPFLVKIAAEKAKRLGLALELDNEGDEVGLSKEKVMESIEMLKNIVNSGSDEECAICLDSLKSPVITPCAHCFCKLCLKSLFSKVRGEEICKCPLCRAEIKEKTLVSIPPETNAKPNEVDELETDWQSSAKIDGLMKHLRQLREQDVSAKCVVVSQFTQFLNVIEVPLEKENFRFVRLDGTMTYNARVDAIQEFSSNKPNSPTIFLLSMTAGGVGINLCAANHVFLMDPAWNPAVEEQCIDRCHRLGQKKPVYVTKFIVNNTVEERMLELQGRKRQLMNEAFGNVKKRNDHDNRQQRVNDIKQLMGF